MKSKSLLLRFLILAGLIATAIGSFFLSRFFLDQLEPQPVFSSSSYDGPTPIPIPSEAPYTVEVQGRIRSFAISPDGKIIALAASQGIVLYDLDNKRQIRVLNEEENFFSVDWAPDSKKLAANGLIMRDSEVGRPHLVVWDTANRQVVFEPALDDSMLDAWTGDVAWSSNGRYLATSNGCMGVTTYDVTTGEIVSKQDVFAGGIADIAWSPDGSRLLATGDMAYAIRRWRVDTDEWVRLFDPRASFSHVVQWSPDGQRIASGHLGGAVCLWTAATNRCDGFIHAHLSDTFSLAWRSDGSQLATGGGVIRIWNTQTGRPSIAFGLSDEAVYKQLAWLKPDLLISLETGYENESPTIVRFWNPTSGEILLEFQGQAGLLWQ